MDHFSCEWTGKVMIEEGGKYTFFTRSDDGSRLWINGKQLVDNWGLHGARLRKGTVDLNRGWHDFKAVHFENAGGANMIVTYKGPDTKNRRKTLQGSHEKSDETDDFAEALETQKPNGFIAKFWYFKKGTNGKGYETDNVKPNLIKTMDKINFPNEGRFRKLSKNF
mgnify:FL=1